eukprot:gene10874-14573_t
MTAASNATRLGDWGMPARPRSLLIVTDAWYPQVNGVVRSVDKIAGELRALGITVELITPADFRTVPMPGYGEIGLSLRLDCGALDLGGTVARVDLGDRRPDPVQRSPALSGRFQGLKLGAVADKREVIDPARLLGAARFLFGPGASGLLGGGVGRRGSALHRGG